MENQVEHPGVSLEARLHEMNAETSSRLASLPREERGGRVSRWKILRTGIRAWRKAYVAGNGKAGLIFAGCAALAAVLQLTKHWEYDLRLREGNGELPPTGKEDVAKLNARYSGWMTG